MNELWIAIGVVAVTLLNLWWDILKPKLIAIWSSKDKRDNKWWKTRLSIIAAGVSIWEMFVTAYRKGILDAIISIIIKIIKTRLGIPTAIKAVKKGSKKKGGKQ